MSELEDPQLNVAAPEGIQQDATQNTSNNTADVLSPTTPASAESATAAEEGSAPSAESSPALAENSATAPSASALNTPEAVMAQLKLLVAAPETADRSALNACNSAFYRLHNEAVAQARAKFVEEGGNEKDFVPTPSPLEAEFKALVAEIKGKRAQQAAEAEAERQANLQRKLDIIAQIKAFAEDAENVDKHYEAFKTLQAEWKEIGTIPAEQVTDTWKNFHHYVEQCYDLLRIHHELREYDFKKNLEIKTQLCETAEQLTTLDDVVSAFHQLQQLHNEFRATGPVAKDQREAIWTRFKAASTLINKRHQDHFLALKAQETENLQKKADICQQVEDIDLTQLHSTSEWEAKAKEIVALQTEWKQYHFAPRKQSQQLFERFRAACDKFFTAKSQFYRNMRDDLTANLAKKTALCERAEAMSESTDWAATTKAFVALQAEWKTVGAVPHKVSDAIWKRFTTACNSFFDRKKTANAAGNETETANLNQKQDIIARLEALIDQEDAQLHEKVKALQAEWNAVGHVPFKKKEKLFRAYRKVCDTLYARIQEEVGRRRVDSIARRAAAQGGNERQRLQRIYDEKKAEIATYETNLSFLTAKSKSGNAFVADVERRIELLKKDLQLLAEKIAEVGE